MLQRYIQKQEVVTPSKQSRERSEHFRALKTHAQFARLAPVALRRLPER